MFSLSITESARNKLAELLKENGPQSVVRFREYQTGTPCARKIVAGLTIDDEKGEDDLSQVVEGLTFVAEPDFVDIHGSRFAIALDDDERFSLSPE
jgi:Fe-S cluster assembly iron-binding protein IscA